jgi:hypothetical protein
MLTRGMIVTLALTALVERGIAQAPGAPSVSPASTSSAATAPNPVSYTWPSATIGNPYPTIGLPIGSAPPACAPNEDSNGSILKGDRLLDSSPWGCGLGWFGSIEVDPVGPTVKNRLNATVAVGGAAQTVQLPSSDLNWTVMPRVELGYVLGQGAGALSMSYQGVNTQGSGTEPGFNGPGTTGPLSSHLNMTVVDLDYSSQELSLGPIWDMKWRTGVRIATIFFDSTATTPVMSQHESNNFTGAGLHFGLDLRRKLGDSGFSVIGTADVGFVLGKVDQLYEETIPGTGSGSTTANQIEPAPVLEVRLGIDYAPHILPNLHFSAGYIYECWWVVGETSGTQGDVNFQGVFVRGEWRY